MSSKLLSAADKVEKVKTRPIVLEVDGSATSRFTPEEQRFFQSWQPTSVATRKDHAESERVRRAIRAAVKECWFNARKVVLRLANYADASYVEGWAVTDYGLAIEHGWIVKDDKVIDPTLPHDVMTYFPGLELQSRAGIEEFLGTREGKKCKKSPYFYAFGWGGMYSPSFRRSWESAMDHVQEIIKAAPQMV